MGILLDTCILAELRQPGGDAVVRAAVTGIPPDSLFLSAVVIGEVSKAISLLAEGHKKRALGSWLIATEKQFADRILPVDGETAHLWGELSARCERAGLVLPVVDGLLAATALRHSLSLMTRSNVYFVATGAMIIDPWKSPEENAAAK